MPKWEIKGIGSNVFTLITPSRMTCCGPSTTSGILTAYIFQNLFNGLLAWLIHNICDACPDGMGFCTWIQKMGTMRPPLLTWHPMLFFILKPFVCFLLLNMFNQKLNKVQKLLFTQTTVTQLIFFEHYTAFHPTTSS